MQQLILSLSPVLFLIALYMGLQTYGRKLAHRKALEFRQQWDDAVDDYRFRMARDITAEVEVVS